MQQIVSFFKTEIFAEEIKEIPSLISELTPLIQPKLQRLKTHLRSRLARKKQWMHLTQIRETSPACLRKNARLTGRTTIEKAGPKQVLMGLKRIQKFDTI